MLEQLLPRNEHTIERVLRIVLGVLLLSLVFVGPKTLWGLFGLLPLLTGFVGSCPLYSVLGISTCQIRRKGGTNEPSATKAT